MSFPQEQNTNPYPGSKRPEKNRNGRQPSEKNENTKSRSDAERQRSAEQYRF